MDRSRLYSLSFVSGAVSRSTVPEIVLSFPEELLVPFYSYVERVRKESHEVVVQYVSTISNLMFVRGEGDRFGYQGCARITRYRGACEIHFELSDFASRCVVVSLSHALVSLNALLHDTDGIAFTIHEQQHVELYIAVGQASSEHSVYGYVYPCFSAWLVNMSENKKSHWRGRVVGAMNEVWTTLTHERIKKHIICMDHGRFLLTCFDNDSDIGMYPDRAEKGSTDTHLVPFGSQSIATHFQQLTLMAGLAEMVGQAERDHSLMCLPMCVTS